jgi:phosphopantetheine--protein transferase-like protein
VTGSARAVHVYYADQRLLGDAIVAGWVTAADRQRLTPTMVARRRTEYLAGRALLRYALARQLGPEAASMPIEVTRDGKPECVGGPAISVSHSADVVACAVVGDAGTAIGIDVEATRPRDLEAIAERFFTPREARWVAQDAEERFRMLWVLKEAYLKALGVGIVGGLDALECVVEPPRIVARVANTAAPQLALLAGRGCHLGIAAADEVPFAVTVERWAPLDAADELGPFTLVATT